MQVLLASNILECPAFFQWVADLRQRHQHEPLLITGDLLNIFQNPEKI